MLLRQCILEAMGEKGQEVFGIALEANSSCKVAVVLLIFDGVASSVLDLELLGEVQREEALAAIHLKEDWEALQVVNSFAERDL